MKIEARHEQPVPGQPRSGTGDQSQLVADVVQAVDAGDQVEAAVGTPGAQGRLDQPEAGQAGVGPVEHPDQIDADDLDPGGHALVVGDPDGLDESFARAAAEVEP